MVSGPNCPDKGRGFNSHLGRAVEEHYSLFSIGVINMCLSSVCVKCKITYFYAEVFTKRDRLKLYKMGQKPSTIYRRMRKSLRHVDGGLMINHLSRFIFLHLKVWETRVTDERIHIEVIPWDMVNSYASQSNKICTRFTLLEKMILFKRGFCLHHTSVRLLY